MSGHEQLRGPGEGYNTESELERLMRSLGEDVTTLQPNHLTVNPPVREMSSFMPTQTSSFMDVLSMPSPTAPWINLISIPDPMQASLRDYNTSPSPGFTLPTSANTQSGYLQQLRQDLFSDLAPPEYQNPWFPQEPVTTRAGLPSTQMGIYNTIDSIQELMNMPISGWNQGSLSSGQFQEPSAPYHDLLMSDATHSPGFSSGLSQGFRTPSPASTMGSLSPVTGSPSPSLSHRRSPSPARLNSLISTLPSTPISSTSSGSFSDGEEEGRARGQVGMSEHVGVSEAGPSASTSKRKTPDRAMEESEEIQSPEAKKPLNKPRKKGPKRVREPRYAIQTRSDVEIMEDGYKWRKYGQKAVKNSPHPRSYYRCTNQKCPVRKRVERSAEDPGLVITTYEGTHTHVSPAAGSRGSTSDAPSLPASGDYRPGGAAYQPPTSFPFSSSNTITPRSTYDLSVQIQVGGPKDTNAQELNAVPSSRSQNTQESSFMRGQSSSGQEVKKPNPISDSFLRAHQILGGGDEAMRSSAAKSNDQNEQLLRELQDALCWGGTQGNPLRRGPDAQLLDQGVRPQSSSGSAEGLLEDIVRPGARRQP